MKHVNAGDFIAAGTPVFSVLDLDVAKVRVAIPEGKIGKIHVGSNASVTLPALAGRSFDGRIDALGMMADPLSRTYAKKIVVGNAVVRDAHGVAIVYI